MRPGLALVTAAAAVACSSGVAARHTTPALRSVAASSPAAASLGTLEQLPDGRSYWLAPAGGGGAHPLLLVLHGLYLSPQNVGAQTHVVAWARVHHVTLAFGVGVHAAWAAGRSCCGYASSTHVDDVAYLRAVVADVEQRTSVDRRRIGAMGDSLGGMMALRAACAVPTVFRLGAAVGGPLLVSCPRGNLIRVRGQHDRTVPAEGGYDRYLRTTLPSLAQEHRLLGAHARERIVVWSGGHAWPQAADGLDATALIGSALLKL
jgi:poly(3-hydroxybutyrate) depolymerase